MTPIETVIVYVMFGSIALFATAYTIALVIKYWSVAKVVFGLFLVWYMIYLADHSALPLTNDILLVILAVQWAILQNINAALTTKQNEVADNQSDPRLHGFSTNQETT